MSVPVPGSVGQRRLRSVLGRRRQTWSGGGRSHIEHREVPPGFLPEFEHEVSAALQAHPGVSWAALQLRPPRIVVEHDELWATTEELVAVVAEVEDRLGLVEAFPSDRPSHPADVEPFVRLLMEMGTDLASFGGAVAGRASGVSPSTLAVDLSRLSTLVDSTPQLRSPLDRRLGSHASDLVLGVGNAVLQGFAQRMTGQLVDAVHRSLLVGEHRSRRAAWRAREQELFADPPAGDLGGAAAPARSDAPVDDPLEGYAARSLEASLAAFTSGLVTTGDLGAAMAPLADAAPKAARLGREAFGAELARVLGRRGVLVMDRQSLRRLDRVDTLAIDGRLLLEVTGSGRPVSPYRIGEPGRELLDRAAAAGLATVASGSFLAEAEVAVDRVVTRHVGLPAAVRELQEEGHSVLAVVSDARASLSPADVLVGVPLPGAAVPHGADLIARAGLDDVALLLAASRVAHDHTQQAVRLAFAGAVLGAASAIGRPPAEAPTRAARAVDAAALAALVNGRRAARSLEHDHTPLRPATVAWHAKDASQVLRELGSDADGLCTEAATSRRSPSEPTPWVPERLRKAVVDELANPLTPVLMAGAGLSLVTGTASDAGLVGLVLGLNAALGAGQRLRADVAVDRLDDGNVDHVRLRRDGAALYLPATEVVPGDVVEVAAGDTVVADCRLLRCRGLEVEEATLTGESVPVAKSAAACSGSAAVAERTSMLFAGTTVLAGEGVAVVVATGDQTEAGRAVLTGDVPGPVTGVDRRLQELTDVTIPAAVGSSVAVLASGLLRRVPLQEVAGSAVTLAVAALPEGLPLLASMGQRAAAQRLTTSGIVSRNVSTIEALGRVDVLCVDKTGTLTEGSLRLTEVSDGRTAVPIGQVDELGELGEPVEPGDRDQGAEVEGLSERHRRVLLAARRSTPVRAGEPLAHATDGAVADGTGAAGVRRQGSGRFDPLDDLHFAPERGYHAVLAGTSRGPVISVKGAPEVVLDRCESWQVGREQRPLRAADRDRLLTHAADLAARGTRVLAVAECRAPGRSDLVDDDVRQLTLLGFVGLRDPARASAADAVRRLLDAGLRVVMVTGDHTATAASVARDVGLGDGGIITAPELLALGGDDLDEVLADVTVIARATPEHKADLVRAFQQRGAVVAMTGDGANDVAAIQLAEVGIALGPRATAAARHAADLVVTDERMETLADAIAEGRGLWASVRDAVAVLVGGNLGEIAFTVAGSLVTGRTPLNAQQLLLVNLFTDVLPATTIAMSRPDSASIEGLLREGPEASLGTILNRALVWRAIGTSAGALAAYFPARLAGTVDHAATTGLVALVGAQLLQTVAARPGELRVWLASAGSAAGLIAIIQTPGLSGAAGCRPLGPIGWTLGTSAAVAGAAVGALGPRVERAVRGHWPPAGREHPPQPGAEPS
ncbi:MAG: cation-transporting P-type ATPase [Nitriliruptoraceae bacterium]